MSAEYIRHELLRHHSVRASTFQSWNHGNIDYHRLVSAGFYYESHRDEIICFSCNIRIPGSVSSTHPFLMHRSQSPNCPFLKGIDLSINRLALGSSPTPLAVSLAPSREIRNLEENFDSVVSCDLERPPTREIRRPHFSGNGSLQEIEAYYKSPIKIPATDRPNSIISIESFFQMMKNRNRRLESFRVNEWPLTAPHPEIMAEAGFFYCLLNDHVQCAFCRCVIGGWNRESDPFEVHREIFPQCQYIQQILSSDVQIIAEFENKRHESRNSITLESSLVCKICFDNEVSVRFNCKHVVTCKDCSVRLIHCPICRSLIKRRYDVILS